MKIKMYVGNKLIVESYKRKRNLTQLIAAWIIFIVVMIFVFIGCSKDDAIQCQDVEGRSILFGRPNTYYLKIKGVQVEVSEADYLAHKVGVTYCY